MLPPLERIASVRPLWQSLTPEERERALIVPLEDLRAYAKEQAARHRLANEAEMAEAAAAGQIILAFDPTLDEVLEQGLTRSKECGTWKIWRWPPDKAEFKDTEAFRKHLEEHLLGPEHRAVLPKEPEGSRPLEQPNEAAFRKRMQDLLISVQERRLAQDEEVAAASKKPGARRQDPLVVMRDATIELIVNILSALEREHESLYQHCLFPVTSFVCDVFQEGSCKTTRTELHPEDLESLLPEDIHRIFEFLQEKLDTLSTRLKPDAAELELEDPDEEPIGDVDLFSLTPDGTALCVNDKWMSHLRSRVLGEDSQPCQAKEGEDPTKAGLALEWVYGTIVSTAEKGRDTAHRTISTKSVSPEDAMEALVNALEDQASLEHHARSSRELLSQMLASRKEATEMGEKYDLRTTLVAKSTAGGGASTTISNETPSKPAASAATGEIGTADDTATNGASTAAAAAAEQPDLPSKVILFLLNREALLTAAKLHALKLEQISAKRELRSYQAELRAGEPQFERLRKELDEIKSAPSRSLDGTYRNTSEMERHRSQLADAAIEEQITAQAEFRKIGARLQKIVDLRAEIEMQINRREQEANQLQLWRRNVCQMVDSLEDNINAAAPLESLLRADGAAHGEVDEEAGEVDDAKRALVAAVKVATRHADELETLRNSFNTTYRKELYVAADDIVIFETVQKQLKEIERRLDEGKVAVQHILQFAINVACDDPGITIGQYIVLPYLQEKLDLKGLEWANEKAAAAQVEVIQMELELEDKQRQEKEKKAKAKAKAKEKARTEKERERADREAKEREAQELEEETKRAAEAAAEEGRKKRAAELEALRIAEEELMERRRKELLADEDSHWRQRSQQDDELRSAQAELEQQIVEETSGLQESKSAAGGGAIKGKDDGFIAAGASNASKRNANRRSGKDSKEQKQQSQPQQQQDSEQHSKQKDGSGSNKAGAALPNNRERETPKVAEDDTPPVASVAAAAAAAAATSTPSSQPIAAANNVPATATTDSVSEGGAATGSPLAPSSPDRVETAQPAIAQPTPGQQQQTVNEGSAPPSAPLSPQQQLPAPGMPFPHPSMMPMPLPPHGMLPPMPPPGTVVGLPPVPGIAMVPPQSGAPPPDAVLPGMPSSHSRSDSGFSGVEESNSPTALSLGSLPIPPPPPPPRPNHQQHMYSGNHPPPPMPVYTGGPPHHHHHPNMMYGPPNGEPIPPHMMRPDGSGPHPSLGYVAPPPPPPPRGAPHHHQGGAGMMHPPPHPYHMQHGGMMPPPPPGVAMGQPFPGPHHGGGRPYQQQQQQLPYRPPSEAQKQNGSGSSLDSSFASRQLRAAAQPFVPSSNSFSIQESGAATSGIDKTTTAADGAPPADGTSDSKDLQGGGDGEEASPRGILEPAELAAATASAHQPGGLIIISSNGTASSTAGDEAASEGAGSIISESGAANMMNGGCDTGQQEQISVIVGGGKAATAQTTAAAAVDRAPTLPPVVDLEKLKSVRGLSNSPGVYNCFLNVIIQSLWHLPAFRKSLLSFTPGELQKHIDTAAADNDKNAAVLISLRAIFEELNSTTENDHIDDTLPLKPVSPHKLREALGGSRFDHGNMHDAAEVLGELFDRLHVAEVGSQGRDPTLPRTVRVDASSFKRARSNKAAAPETQPVGHLAKDSAWGNAAALNIVKKALALADAEAKSHSGGSSSAAGKGSGSGSAVEKKEIVSMVQKLFGMEVQAPLHNDTNSKSNNNSITSANGGKGGKSKGGNKSSSSNTATGTVEALQFTRYFHLVPAQSLRTAAATAPSFEAALVAATGNGSTPPTERLLSNPAVFTLSTVFESPQVPAPALAATLSALQPELDISRLFLNTSFSKEVGEGDDDAATSFNYRLRCMVCYSSSHYFAFALSEEVGQWLLLDDAHVSAVGHWKDVQATAAERRLQPSLLFYEAVPSAE